MERAAQPQRPTAQARHPWRSSASTLAARRPWEASGGSAARGRAPFQGPRRPQLTRHAHLSPPRALFLQALVERTRWGRWLARRWSARAPGRAPSVAPISLGASGRWPRLHCGLNPPRRLRCVGSERPSAGVFGGGRPRRRRRAGSGGGRRVPNLRSPARAFNATRHKTTAFLGS